MHHKGISSVFSFSRNEKTNKNVIAPWPGRFCSAIERIMSAPLYLLHKHCAHHRTIMLNTSYEVIYWAVHHRLFSPVSENLRKHDEHVIWAEIIVWSLLLNRQHQYQPYSTTLMLLTEGKVKPVLFSQGAVFLVSNTY